MILCILALFVAQTFGAKGNYVCECGGAPVLTPVSHCYGPHGEKCAEVEAQGVAATDDNDTGDRRDHEVVDTDVQSRPLEAPSQIVGPQVLLAILPMVDAFSVRPEVKVPASYLVDIGDSPPFGVTVARTIVLLI